MAGEIRVAGGATTHGNTPQTASAPASLEVNLGHTIIRGPANVFGVDLVFPRAIKKAGDIACGLYFVGEYEMYGESQPNQGAVQCMAVTRLNRFRFGLGPAYLQNTDAINGSNFNFALMARWQVTDSLSLSWRHWSNAGTKLPNLGRDFITVGWRF